jgi:hypothetical protein
MAMRLISATGQPLAALALLAALCACASSATAPSVETRAPGWRIVERTGVARYMPPESAAWIPATIDQALTKGSEVTTGSGGRLIIDAPGRHLSVGPDSHFVLPGEDGDAWLEQRAGWLRYRIAEAAAEPLRIHTRTLELELSSGVVDVQVNHLATGVTVKEGQVRVGTPDGLRQTQMIAGQSARAGEAGGTMLAVRMAPDQPLQAIEPVVVPALQPKPRPAGSAAVAPPARPTTGVSPAPPASATAIAPAVSAAAEPLVLHPAMSAQRAGPQPLRGGSPPAQPTMDRHDGAFARHGTGSAGAAARSDDAYGDLRAIAPATRPNGPAAIRRSQFERLTTGVLDGLQPSRPAPSARPAPPAQSAPSAHPAPPAHPALSAPGSI